MVVHGGKALCAVLAFAAAISGCGESALPVESTQPVEGFSSVDDFSLSIRSARAVYAAWEPMDVQASLTYVGPGETVDIEAPQDLIGFGFQQLDGILAREAANSLMPERFEISRGTPLVESFNKIGIGCGANEPNADFYQSFSRDPELRLPIGTWRLYARIQVGLIGRELEDLMAEVTVHTR